MNDDMPASRHRWWSKPWIRFIALVLGVLLVLLGVHTIFWLIERARSRQPDVVEISGVVTDGHTKAPIEGAYVVINFQSYHGSLGGSHWGCPPGSSVVRTDASGRYRYRWAWAEHQYVKPAKIFAIDWRAYVPGMQYENSWPWGVSLPASEGTSTTLVVDSRPLSERLEWLARMLNRNCAYDEAKPSFVSFSRAIYLEAWRGICEQMEPVSGDDFVLGLRVMGIAESGLNDGRNPRYQDAASRRFNEVGELIPAQRPWATPQERLTLRDPVSRDAANQVCALYAQPLEVK